MRNSNGQFVKGYQHSPETQFKKGEHWRNPKPHWEKDWLIDKYVINEMSASEIAEEAGCTEANIYYWMKKHDIERRDISEARKIKQWGSSGKDNGMYGRTGEQNPRYVDGSSPERQRLYAQSKGKEFIRKVLKRDNYRCKKCSSTKTSNNALHVHHIKPWAGNPDSRFDFDNVITLCASCHYWVHSNENKHNYYIDNE